MGTDGTTLMVTNIQGYSVNDGPGIRTTVFTKGCPLRCEWCHNPECIYPQIQIEWRKAKCTQCGTCLQVCPEDAISPPIPPDEAQAEGSTYYKIDLERCNKCMKCVEVCPNEALFVVGSEVLLEEILHEVRREYPFYLNSGGGLTISGGEPTTQIDAVKELLMGARRLGVHTCVDTCAYTRWEQLEPLIKLTSLFLIDVKNMDDVQHIARTGVSNRLILENIRRLAERGAKMRLRCVVIPGFNDNEEHFRKVGELAQSLGDSVEGIDILPFHNYCMPKYEQLGMQWSMASIDSLAPEDVAQWDEIVKSYGVETTIGG